MRAVDDRPQQASLSAASERASRPSRLAAALDFASDLGVLAFAVWTLIAYVGMITDARVSLLVPLWLATVPFLAGLLVLLSRRAPVSGSASAPAAGAPARPYARGVLVAAVALGLASALIAAVAADEAWPAVWVGPFIAVAAAVWMGRLRGAGPPDPAPAPGWPADAFAVLVGLWFAVMSLFISRPNGDDTFYVNRATGTAQLDRIPVRDIILTDERVGPVSGTGLPVDTFSALQGGIGRLLDVHGASVAYYLTPPLLTFFATWALWRLLRAWAPRNVVLCFALGCVYWVFSAQTGLTPGSYFLNRMWQGKVIFVAWLVLTAYVFLTRWLSRRDALTAVLILAVGVSSIGMTASAAFVAPLLFGAAALPLLLRREWRGLPVLAAAAAFPFVVGLVAARQFPLVEIYQLEENVGDVGRGTFSSLPTWWYFNEVFGLGVVAAVGLIGLWAAPWLARTGAAAQIATGISVVSIFLLAPAVLPALNAVTNLTSVLRRVFWIVPFPAMVGLLGAAVVGLVLGRLAKAPPPARRAVVAAPALAIAALLVAFGHPLWTSWRHGTDLWVREPAWKVRPQPLKDAHAILRNYEGSERILAEEPIMHAIALVTVRPKTVNARSFYVRLTPEPPQRIRDRLALTRFVSGEKPNPSRREVERALADLRVGLVCVDESRPLVIREVEALGNYEEAFSARALVCFERRGPTAAAAASASASD